MRVRVRVRVKVKVRVRVRDREHPEMPFRVKICKDGVVCMPLNGGSKFVDIEIVQYTTVSEFLETMLSDRKHDASWVFLPEATLAENAFYVCHGDDDERCYVVTEDGVYKCIKGMCTTPCLHTNALQKQTLREMLTRTYHCVKVGCGGRVVVCETLIKKTSVEACSADETKSFPSEELCNALGVKRVDVTQVGRLKKRWEDENFFAAVLWLGVLPMGGDERKSVFLFNSARFIDESGSTAVSSPRVAFCKRAPHIVFLLYSSCFDVCVRIDMNTSEQMQRVFNALGAEAADSKYSCRYRKYKFTDCGHAIITTVEDNADEDNDDEDNDDEDNDSEYNDDEDKKTAICIHVLSPDLKAVSKPLMLGVKHNYFNYDTCAIELGYLAVLLEPVRSWRIYKIGRELTLRRIIEKGLGLRSSHQTLCKDDCSQLACHMLPFTPAVVKKMCYVKRNRLFYILCIMEKLKKMKDKPVLPWELWLFILEIYSDYVI